MMASIKYILLYECDMLYQVTIIWIKNQSLTWGAVLERRDRGLEQSWVRDNCSARSISRCGWKLTARKRSSWEWPSRTEKADAADEKVSSKKRLSRLRLGRQAGDKEEREEEMRRRPPSCHRRPTYLSLHYPPDLPDHAIGQKASIPESAP